MMKLCGIQWDRRAVNFLAGKVPEAYLTSYNNHRVSVPDRRKFLPTVLPDIQANNVPNGQQIVNGGGATSAAEVFFEVKAIQPCLNRYANKNLPRTAFDRRAHIIRYQEYSNKLRIIYEKFVADLLDPINPGPYMEAQGSSVSGGVIPLVASAFGEASIDLVKLLNTLTKHAFNCDEGLSILPLLNTDQRGGAT